MELIEVMRHRRSIRKYTEEAIPDVVLEKILGVEDPFRIVGILALGVPAEKHEAYSLSELKWEKVHTEE